MHIPPRTKMKAFGSSQGRMLFYLSMGLNTILATVFVLIGIQYHLDALAISAGVISLLVFQILLGFVLGFQYQRQQRELLTLNGLEAIKPKKFDAQLKSVCTVSTLGFHNEPCKIAFSGSFNTRKIIISEHRNWQPHISNSTRWAIWTPLDLPLAFIGPKSHWVDNERTLGHEGFDRIRSLSTRDEKSVRKILLPLVDWFIPKDQLQTFEPDARLFSKNETWLFDGHWILFADYGLTDAVGKMRMAEFLIAFVEQLESKALNCP